MNRSLPYRLCETVRDLMRYARHLPGCAVFGWDAMVKDSISESEAMCDCGWRQVRKKADRIQREKAK